MDAISYLLVFTGLALELCLVWRLLRLGMWHTYSCLSLYLLWVTLHTLVLLAVTYLAPARFATIFWISDAIGLPLGFLVVWEVFRHTFPRGSSLSRIASKGFVVTGCALAILVLDAFLGFKAYALFNSIYLALDRSFGFSQAALTMGLLLAGRYYGVRLGRNVWGIAFGFGVWSSILAANNALHDLDHAFVPFWQYVSPVSFMGMLCVWIWAVWSYAPNPVEAEVADEADMNAWTEEWDRTVSSVRRAIHP